MSCLKNMKVQIQLFASHIPKTVPIGWEPLEIINYIDADSEYTDKLIIRLYLKHRNNVINFGDILNHFKTLGLLNGLRTHIDKHRFREWSSFIL